MRLPLKDWTNHHSGLSLTDKKKAIRKKLNSIMVKQEVQFARLLIVSNVDEVLEKYNTGTVHILAKTTDKQAREIEWDLTEYIRKRDFRSTDGKMKAKGLVRKRKPSNHSKKRNISVCVIISDLNIKKFRPMKPSNPASEFRVGTIKIGEDGNKWIVSKKWSELRDK